MKKLSLILCLLLTFSLNAQINSENESIQGKINVDEFGDPAGINVFNISSNAYTFSDQYGRFNIEVALHDTLVFSGVQYQQFSVVITPGVLQQNQLQVNLHTVPIQLKRVVVKPDLTGSVVVDVKRLETPEINFENFKVNQAIYGYQYEFKPDRLSPVQNDALNKRFIQNGLNFVNIFKALFLSKTEVATPQPHKALDVEVRKMYDDEFFKTYLEIPEDHINEFIFYLESQGLTVDKLRNTNDLELLQFILKKGKQYKMQMKE